MAHWTQVSDRCPFGYLFILIFCSAVIVLVDFKMYIVSYNSVHNGLVYFICLYIYMYVM